MVTAGGPAVCPGTVMHHRRSPTEHRFTYRVTQVWLDPDDPNDLCRHHPLWSARRPAPVWFRRTDYLDGTTRPIGPQLRNLVAEATGIEATGPIRMLTQARTLGWLFNPITVYLLWDDGPEPVAAVLEVTNTPWKERHHYAVALDAGAGSPRASDFDKVLHVSPFLDEGQRYRLVVAEAEGPNGTRRLSIDLDVVDDRIQAPSDNGGDVEKTVVATRLVVDRYPADRTTMTNAMRAQPLPTHLVSAGIHRQALALWRKGVPFVAHPRRRASAEVSRGQS